MALLLSCVRATLLSRRFREAGDLEFPERDGDGVLNRIVNRVPAAVWPRARIVFFVCAGLLLLLTVLGEVAILANGLAHTPAMSRGPSSVWRMLYLKISVIGRGTRAKARHL